VYLASSGSATVNGERLEAASFAPATGGR